MTQPAGSFFQLGYVTSDIDAAVDVAIDGLDVREFLRFDAPPADGSGGAGARVALAWRGDVMVEIYQPPTDAPAIYTGGPNTPLWLHHLGYFVSSIDELDALTTQYAGRGIDVPVRLNDRFGVSAIMADTGSHTGHASEHVYLHEAGRELFDRVPRS